MSFKSHGESGFPSGYDYYSQSPEDVAKNRIQTPSGFGTLVSSAIVNQHQNPDETKPVGTPGTTYTPHRRDDIIHTEGGHAIILGNAPGSETLRIQSKHGATVELQSDGSFVLMAPQGLHVSVGGDGQFVFHSDVHFVTNGDFKVKAAGVYFDCTDMHMNVNGDMLTNVQNNYALNVDGDKHVKTVGDNSETVGGSNRNTIAGDHWTQVSGDMSYSGKGTATFNSIGDMKVATKAKMETTAEGDMKVSTKANMVTQADGTMNTKAKGDMTVATQGTMKNTAKGRMYVASDGDLEVGSDGVTRMTGTTAVSMTSAGKVDVGASGIVSLQGSVVQSNPPIIAGGSVPVQSPPVRDAASTDIPSVEVKVADDKQVIDSISDWVATDGELVRILNAQQLHEKYNTEDGGTIPDKVKQRAQELGIDVDQKPYEDSLVDQAVNVPSTGKLALDGNLFNPVG